jgi:proton-dependent oligopeptide transporter, POT family
VAINSGFFVSSLAAPLIRTHYGYRTAFLVPAGLMVISFSLFGLGKPFHAKETVRPGPVAPIERREQWRVLRRRFGLFAVVAFFWSVIEQYDNTWVHFARDHVELNVFDFAPGTWQASVVNFVQERCHVNLAGTPLDPDQFQSLNAIFIITLVPIIAVVWHLLARAGLRLRPTDKMFIGFLCTLATPLILAIAAAQAGAAGRVSAWWLVAVYFVITTAEVCISVVGLELAFAGKCPVPARLLPQRQTPLLVLSHPDIPDGRLATCSLRDSFSGRSVVILTCELAVFRLKAGNSLLGTASANLFAVSITAFPLF